MKTIKSTSSKGQKRYGKNSILSYILFVGIVVMTGIAFQYLESEKASVSLVWSFGWITAASTGLGALPFFLVKNMSGKSIGVSNSAAAGMMIAASFNLILEAIFLDPSARRQEEITQHGVRCSIVGCAVGVAFMIYAKREWLDKYDKNDMYSIGLHAAKRTLLIVFVMTVHSFSEGIAIGVAFAGEKGMTLGTITATSLAIHNVPEGVAVSLALVPKGASPVVAALWSVASSLPQPIMAVVAYIFVEKCVYLLPAGLGFAAGAMVWVSLTELMREALEEISVWSMLFVTALSSYFMVVLQDRCEY